MLGQNTNSSNRVFDYEKPTEDLKYLKKAGLELDKLEYLLMNNIDGKHQIAELFIFAEGVHSV